MAEDGLLEAGAVEPAPDSGTDYSNGDDETRLVVPSVAVLVVSPFVEDRSTGDVVEVILCRLSLSTCAIERRHRELDLPSQP